MPRNVYAGTYTKERIICRRLDVGCMIGLRRNVIERRTGIESAWPLAGFWWPESWVASSTVST